MSAFAFGNKIANDGYLGHGSVNAQRYSPQLAKRQFSPAESEEIEEGKNRLMPTIFQSYGTPVSEMMASPLKQSLIAGVPAALLGAAAGHALGGQNHSGLGAVLGGLGAGGLAGAARYFGQQSANEGLEELMRRLPAGATKRDLLADPAYQADLDRRNELRAARMSYNGGGIRGKFASEKAALSYRPGRVTLPQLIGRRIQNSAVGRMAQNPFVQGGAVVGGGLAVGDAANKALASHQNNLHDAAEYRRLVADIPTASENKGNPPSTFADQVKSYAQPLMNAVQTPVGSAGALGAMAGGLYGAFNPDVDERGRPKNRLRNALMGVVGGAGVGALGSMAAQHFLRPQNQLTIGYGPHQFSMTVPNIPNNVKTSSEKTAAVYGPHLLLRHRVARGLASAAKSPVAPFLTAGAGVGGAMAAGNYGLKPALDAAYPEEQKAAPATGVHDPRNGQPTTVAEHLHAYAKPLINAVQTHAQPLMNAVQTPVGAGGALGAMAGGLYGALNPEVDERGRAKNRLRNALIGLAGGAGVGALGGMAMKHFLPQAKTAAANAFEFGQKAAFINFKDPRVVSGLGGAALGAGIGGLAGAFNPGEDENGRKRNRFGAALAGALGGAGVGGLSGAAAGHLMKDNPTMQQFGDSVGSRLAGLFGGGAKQPAAPSPPPVPGLAPKPIVPKSVDDAAGTAPLQFPPEQDPLRFPEENPNAAMFIDPPPPQASRPMPRQIQAPSFSDAALGKARQDMAAQEAGQRRRWEAAVAALQARQDVEAGRVAPETQQRFRDGTQQMLQMQRNMLSR